MSTNSFGKLGEDKAADFLIAKGYRILERNYRYRKAEVDIIAQKNDILAIVEVKSRSSEQIIQAHQTVNRKKIDLLIAAADHYVVSKDLDVEVRFDIITVVKKWQSFEMEHIEDAFYHF